MVQKACPSDGHQSGNTKTEGALSTPRHMDMCCCPCQNQLEMWSRFCAQNLGAESGPREMINKKVMARNWARFWVRIRRSGATLRGARVARNAAPGYRNAAPGCHISPRSGIRFSGALVFVFSHHHHRHTCAPFSCPKQGHIFGPIFKPPFNAWL